MHSCPPKLKVFPGGHKALKFSTGIKQKDLPSAVFHKSHNKKSKNVTGGAVVNCNACKTLNVVQSSYIKNTMLTVKHRGIIILFFSFSARTRKLTRVDGKIGEAKYRSVLPETARDSRH